MKIVFEIGYDRDKKSCPNIANFDEVIATVNKLLARIQASITEGFEEYIEANVRLYEGKSGPSAFIEIGLMQRRSMSPKWAQGSLLTKLATNIVVRGEDITTTSVQNGNFEQVLADCIKMLKD